jgi:capsular polysaccharide export protein
MKKEQKILQSIFSIKNVGKDKICTILGVKFKIKIKKTKDLSSTSFATLFDLCQDENIRKNIVKPFEPEKLLSQITQSPKYLAVDSKHNFLNILLNCEAFTYKENDFNSDNVLISWEIRPTPRNLQILQQGIRKNKNILYIGDSFLRSINTHADDNVQLKYQKGISFTLDDLTSYFDATRMSRLEQMLNDKNLVITEEQKQRARICINKIVETHLTKYNHQPIFEPKIGREGVPKVLVVDQSYGDMSISKGLGSDETFENMLECAIKENPDADIIVKTHPDTMTGNRGGYYTGLKQHDNIYTQTEPINPISLIKYVDKVYVCTTQFGFEALMCGKEVNVFGMPFYAGWGLTKDRQTCDRRTNKRSLEEIFYIAYIMYSYYVNPDKKCRCEIEEAMDYLLNLREEYFKGK